MIEIVDLKEKFTPIKKLFDYMYVICWDYKEGSGDYATWMQHKVDHKPTLQEVKDLILSYYNDKIDNKILKGFVWNDMPVWLSSENQFNYKAAYDLAVQTNGESLPVTFKFGTTENPVYHTFTNMEEFNQFYTEAINFINTTLSDGWIKKDSINWSVYEIDE